MVLHRLEVAVSLILVVVIMRSQLVACLGVIFGGPHLQLTDIAGSIEIPTAQGLGTARKKGKRLPGDGFPAERTGEPGHRGLLGVVGLLQLPEGAA